MGNKLLLALFLGAVLPGITLANEALFSTPFSEIKKESEKASKKREEITRNVQLLDRLSKKKILLEAEISSMLEEIAKAPDFNMEAMNVKTSGVNTDVTRSGSINSSYSNINKELKETWNTPKK